MIVPVYIWGRHIGRVKMDKYICTKKLETITVYGKRITVHPGSVWIMKPITFWNREFIMTNIVKPEWEIDVSQTVFDMCFKKEEV